MASEEQLEWVFDSLVEFLRGPIWNIPVLTFIEQKSVVFEPGAENEEELRKIHEAYKNLVDFMLGSYMEDLRITPDEFERSCSVATKKALNQFHQNLFQQVWAADDFEIFKRMMTQKNLELQLQALEFLTQKRGSVPNCMEPNNDMKDDEKAMEEIIKRAIEDVSQELDEKEAHKSTPTDAMLHEKMKMEAQNEKDLLEKAIQQSVKEKDIDESEKPEKEEDTESPPIDDTPSNSLEGGDGESNPEETLSVETTNILEETRAEDSDATAEAQSLTSLPKLNLHGSLPPLEPAKSVPRELPPLRTSEERPLPEGDAAIYDVQGQVEVSRMEMEKRQNYLRQQRDRILAMKKQERSRRLSNADEVITQARPKSAKAARKALREEDTGEVDPQTLAFRKSLAAKLRSEVIDKSD